ncbi:glycosyltransferase [Aeoliella mucimassa]|uniref:N-glycosyltransferase n=1 Tax=Aeoliella mucimassa TaxID=2527972 RepID=A0A518AQA3_9BACT|nr:glycosyltransferase [Aeoliella mucimassa]QDU56901.1 N-glycosyltransferase [Aeoliella mucimassa]
MIRISVITCTYNGAWCLDRTIAALGLQSLPVEQWELVVVDNASKDNSAEVALEAIKAAGIQGRVLHEAQPGKSYALQKAFREIEGRYFCVVDDDNLLDADYLESAVQFMDQNANIGMIGGKVLPEFEQEDVDLDAISPWASGMLAVRDFGDEVVMGKAPIGAGMVGRTQLMQGIYQHIGTRLPDRIGDGPGCCEDLEKTAVARMLGWEVAYVPMLQLTHVIPAKRLDVNYIESIVFAMQWAWVWLEILKKPATHRSRGIYLRRSIANRLYAFRYRLLSMVSAGSHEMGDSKFWYRFYNARAVGYVSLIKEFSEISRFLANVKNAPAELRPGGLSGAEETASPAISRNPAVEASV